MTTDPFADRNAQMCQMRSDGHTLQSIADTFGITRQRVEQITRGIKPLRIAHGARVSRSEDRRRQRVEQLRPLLSGDDAMRLQDAAAQTGIPLPVVSSIARQEGWSKRQTVWTAEAILEAMERWHAQYGKPPTSYDWNVTLSRHPRTELLNYPASSTVANVFGGWGAAREALNQRLGRVAP